MHVLATLAAMLGAFLAYSSDDVPPEPVSGSRLPGGTSNSIDVAPAPLPPTTSETPPRATPAEASVPQPASTRVEVESSTTIPPASEPAAAPEPATRVTIDYAARPAWVEQRPSPDEPGWWDGSVYRIAVSSKPHLTLDEARRALQDELEDATARFVDHHLGHSRASLLPNMAFERDYIRTYLVKPNAYFDEQIQVSLGPMHQSHALLEFGPSFREEVDRRWSRVVQGSRLLKVGLVAGGTFLLLTTLFGYFRVDTATRGYYSGRLRVGTVAAILAVVVTCVVLAKWIPWI